MTSALPDYFSAKKAEQDRIKHAEFCEFELLENVPLVVSSFTEINPRSS